MRENIIQKRKISAAICEEWLERDKVLSGRQKDAIRQYVRMHTDKPEELYQIYHAMIRGENYKAETLEVLMEEGQPVIKIAGNEIRAAFEQLNDFVQKLILLTERTLPLGSVVEVDIRELKLETEKPVSSIKAVIVDRFMKKETEKQYVPYCGIIYPFGDSKKQLFFTEQAIHTVIHYGYTDMQNVTVRYQSVMQGLRKIRKRSGNGKKKLIFMRIRTDAWKGDRKIWLIFVLVIAGKSVRQEIIFRR